MGLNMGGWTDVLQKLVGGVNEGLNGAPGQAPSTLDELRVKEGMRYDNGVGGFLHNLGLIGAQSRVQGDETRKADEDRAIKNDYTKSLTESNRSLVPYRQGVLAIKDEYNKVQQYKADIANVTTMEGLKIKAGELQARMDQAQAALQNAETNARNTTNSEERLQFDQRAQAERMKLDWYKTLSDVDLRKQATAIQGGYLGIAQDKLPGELNRTDALTGLTNAQTEKTGLEAQGMNSAASQYKTEADAVKAGTDAGLNAPSSFLGSLMEKAGIGGSQTPTPQQTMEGLSNPPPAGMPPRTTPVTAPVAAPAQSSPAKKVMTPAIAKTYLTKAQGNMILAKRLAKADGYQVQ
jgi:hypothetical protein